MPFAVQTDPAAPPPAGIAAWIGEAAALSFAEEFQALGLEAFSREERVAAFDRLQLPMSSSLTRATTIRTGELIGASDVVVGDVRLGKRLVVRARIIRIDVASQSPDVEEQGAMADMVAVFAGAADALARSTGRAPAGPPRRGRPSAASDVFENYVKGLVAIAPALAAAIPRGRRIARSRATAGSCWRSGACTRARDCTRRRSRRPATCPPIRRASATRGLPQPCRSSNWDGSTRRSRS